MGKSVKAISIVVTVIFLSVLLMTGCGSQSNTTTTGQPTKTETVQKADTGKTELAPYELTVVLRSVDKKDKDLVEAKMSDLVKSKINATVKFIFINSANWLQQTNLMSAGNEKMDVMWTSSFYGYSSVVSKGQVLPLDELIGNYGKDISSVLGEKTLNACKIDNKLYAVPSTRDMAADFGVIVRKDIAAKYNIDLTKIKTMDDLTPVFKTVKENEESLTPTAGFTSGNTAVGYILRGFFDPLDDRFGVLRLKDNNLKVINLYDTPEYSEFVNIMRKWYLAGYNSKDAATTTEDPKNLMRVDKLFSYFHSFKPGIENQESMLAGKDLAAVRLTDAVANTSTITVMMAAIPKSSQNPERAMMLLNLWYSDKDLVNLFDNGIEGTHYVKDADGFISYPSNVDSKSTGWLSNNYLIGNNYLSLLWKGYEADVWKKTEEFNNSAKMSNAMGFSFNAEPVKTELAAVSSVVDEYRMGLETGTLDPAVKLQEFNTKLKAAGIEKVIAEKQSQLDKWSNNSK